MPGRFSALLLLAYVSTAAGQPAAKALPDHGPVLAAAMEVAPGKLKDTTDRAATKNYVFRGKVITLPNYGKLDKDKSLHVCFDTELMRVAGAWVGPYPGYTADKNMGPPVTGPLLFTTAPGPGWAKDGKWDDPRPGKEGPLPKDWAHYKGLYMHDKDVVLSYTVGDCPVLECFEGAAHDKHYSLNRTLKLGATKTPFTLLVCDLTPEDIFLDGTKRRLVWKANSSLRRSADDGFRVIEAYGLPSEARWKIEGRRLLLQLPTLPNGAHFTICDAYLHHQAGYKSVDPGLINPLELPKFDKGGPPRWTEPLETQGVVAPAGKEAYVVDEITAPEKNPWHAPMRFGGLDFFPDGRAALCTWDGDVWIVSGLDDGLKKVRWKRFAAGLQQPLGLKIIDGVIHTAGRDQVTRLHDLNGDGEADFYENLNNDPGLTLQRHEFVLDLQTDAAGNLYYCRSGHYIQSKRGDNCCVYKLSPDGKTLEKIATGFREPNGLSVAPDGTMTVADNEGNGIPQTPIYHLRPGTFYGFTPPAVPETHGKHSGYQRGEPAVVWLPKHVDTSAGTQVPVTSDKWGPLKGGLLHTSYGNSALFALLVDRAAEPWQGAVYKFPLRFASGVMRGRFSPTDGQLYLCGLRGWGTNAAREGTFCRVRYTGRPARMPVGVRVTKAGLALTFAEPLDRAAAEDDGNWGGDWADLFGGPGRPAKTSQELPIGKVTLSADGRTAEVALDELRPVTNYRLQYRLRAADGAPVTGEVYGTINRVPR